MTQHINPQFNQHILGSRPIPRTPDGLAKQIIARAKATAVEGNLMVMLVLPRPYFVLSILFILAFVAGFGLDLGFNSTDEIMVSEEDILYAFEGEVL